MRGRTVKLAPCCLMVLWLFWLGVAGAAAPTGGIEGHVRDAHTLLPIPGATVTISGESIGVAADYQGLFALSDIPAGAVALDVRSIGYKPQAFSQIRIDPGKTKRLELHLYPLPVEVDEITVIDYFPLAEDHPLGTATFTGDEVRRTPGAAGDLCRAMTLTPGVSKTNDQFNSLAVRGGHPVETGFRVDNFEMPNINHYPLMGSSGGPICLIDAALVSDLQFMTGGFPAEYGGRLSSQMAVNLREGRTDRVGAELSAGLGGLSVTVEGPLGHPRSSWLVTVRRSLLDWLVPRLGMGAGPAYYDGLAKVVVEATPRHRLTFLTIYGQDRIDIDIADARDMGLGVVGFSEGREYTAGIGWFAQWGKFGYSNATVAISSIEYGAEFGYTHSARSSIWNRSRETMLTAKWSHHLKAHQKWFVSGGVEAKAKMDHYRFHAGGIAHLYGGSLPLRRVDESISASEVASYATVRFHPDNRFSFSLGIRPEYLDREGALRVLSRLSAGVELGSGWRVRCAAGVYQQPVPEMLRLSSILKAADISSLRARHLILGLSWQVRPEVRVAVEGYHKYYWDLPVDLYIRELSPIDELGSEYMNSGFGYLVAEGEAESFGVELTIQRRFRHGLYGIIVGSISRSHYRDGNGTWRDRQGDNQFNLGFEGGIRPNNRWEISWRWILAGGHPYAPVDVYQSRWFQADVHSRKLLNQERYPDYHSLNLRVDHHIYFQNRRLTLYGEVWNVFDRDNVLEYYWDEGSAGSVGTRYQWGRIPMIGLEYRF